MVALVGFIIGDGNYYLMMPSVETSPNRYKYTLDNYD